MTDPTIIEAMAGPFAGWLGDPEPWAPWRAFLKAMTAEPMDDDERALFQQCTGRDAPPAEPVKEAWVIAGRRARKSATAAIIGCHAALYRDWSAFVAPGEVARVLIVATTMDQARLIRSYAEAILESHPALSRRIAARDQYSVTLTNGIVIECAANSFRSVRGPTTVCAIFEELAFWRSDESANPDREVLRAVRPSMLTVPGALLIGISSPYSKKGLLWEKFRDHFGRDGKVLIWQADTETMNPSVDADEIEAAYADDATAAAAEYGAIFRDDLSTFLDADLLVRLTRPAPLELEPRADLSYCAFTDPSGGRGDSFSIAIAHRDPDGIVIDLVRATRPPFDPKSVVSDYAALVKSYGLSAVVGDNYSAEWVAAAFRDCGVAYRSAEKPKSQIYLECLPQFTRERVELPDHRPLLVELQSLERRTARGGRDSVDHPPRGHDDLANAACGAIHLCADRGVAFDLSHVALGDAPAALTDRDSPWRSPVGGSAVGAAALPDSWTLK